MASVFVRPGGRWYGRIKDREGKWISRRVRQQTRKEALRVARQLEAQEERIRLGLEAAPQRGQLCGPLLRRWASSLTNRSRGIDLGRIDKHLLPRWRAVPVSAVTLATIMGWLDDLAAGPLSPGSRRHLLGTLSRFMSWAVERGLAPRNPVRDLPSGSRPRVIPPRPEDVPWLADDADVLRVMRALPAPFDAVFYVGNRCGMRLSEILALRLSDLAELEAGTIRCRFAGDDGRGPLKEDKAGVGKQKFVPAPTDAPAVLGPILDARRAAGAGPEAFLFVDNDGRKLDRHQVDHRWAVARRALGLPAALTFYRGTRHSFASRALASGAGLDEVSAALGHATPATTLRHYNHHVRKRFSPILTAGLGLDGAPGGKVIAIGGRSPATEAGPSAANGGEHAA